MQTIELVTFFDCTRTNVVHHKKSELLTPEEWEFRRNQQRNYETVLQCISLRCQPLNIQGPYVFTNQDNQLYWNIRFDTDKQDIFLKKDNPVGILIDDCHYVPMIIGLTESEKELFFTPYMITHGTNRNTYIRLFSNK